MENLHVDYKKTLDFISSAEIERVLNAMKKQHELVHNQTGQGNDFLGWVDLPTKTGDHLIDEIKESAEMLKNEVEIVVVVGIGGSYLGARAVIDTLDHSFSSYSTNQQKYPHIIYAGNNISEDYLADLTDILQGREFALVVISKSGTTTEPAIAFRILRKLMKEKYHDNVIKERIIAITDKSKGALKKLADTEGYKSYVIPDDVGGRYSVLTPVGLLPIAAAGFNISELLQGARDMENVTKNIHEPLENPAAVYASVRNVLYKNGKWIEILASYMPSLQYFIEWWKQLYGESEGKDGKGIFPAGVNFTTDLHSMGQYIQDGERKLFETVISIDKSRRELVIPKDAENLDKLNYISGKRIHDVNKKAELGTILAHIDGGVPNILIKIPQINEYYLGQLIYFFEKACAYSGYQLGVNPFDQPGVEAYKKNMFALLGKPGFEEETKEINKRI